MTLSVDLSGLETYRDKIEKLKNGQTDEFMEVCCKELAKRIIAKASKRTPVDTGVLRRGWTAGRRTSASRYVESLEIQQNGDSYEITISNPTEYASYVEYGHRSGKKWTKGKFMLSIAVSEVENVAPELLEKKLEQWLKEGTDGD